MTSRLNETTEFVFEPGETANGTEAAVPASQREESISLQMMRLVRAKEWGVETWAVPDGNAVLVLTDGAHTCADGETRPTHDASGHLLWVEERHGFRVGTVNARSAASAPAWRECEMVTAERQSAALERFRQAAMSSDGIEAYSEPARWWVGCERVFRRRLTDGAWEPSGHTREFDKNAFSSSVEWTLHRRAQNTFYDACVERMDETLNDYDADLDDALFGLPAGAEEDAEDEAWGAGAMQER